MNPGDFSEEQANPYAAPRAAKPSMEERLELQQGGPGRVRFSAIGEAWDIASSRRGTWALMILVLWGSSIAVSLVSIVAQAAVHGGFPKENEPSSIGEVLVSLVFLVISVGVQSFLMAGLYRAACKQVRGESIQVGDIFGAPEVTLNMFFATMLYGLCVLLGLILFIIPGLIVAGRLMLVFPLVADGRMSASDAVGASWRALKGQSLNAFAFQFVVGIVSGVGVCLCGFGLLLTYPILFLATAIIYRDFFNVKVKDAGSTAWPELA